MSNEQDFIKKLEAYLGLEFNDFDCNRIKGYLDEYSSNFIRPVERPVKVITEKKIVYRYITVKDKRVKRKDMIIFIKPTEILDIVVEKTGVSFEKIQGKRRDGDILVARHVAIYLIRKECDRSWKSVGALFNRDHTTAIHAYHHVEDMIQSGNPKYTALLNEILLQLPEPMKNTA